jgi:hypothetical protein
MESSSMIGSQAIVDPPDLRWAAWEADGEVHVGPLGDFREHLLSRQCWCQPREDDEADWVIIHHSMDRREEFENGRALG